MTFSRSRVVVAIAAASAFAAAPAPASAAVLHNCMAPSGPVTHNVAGVMGFFVAGSLGIAYRALPANEATKLGEDVVGIALQDAWNANCVINEETGL